VCQCESVWAALLMMVISYADSTKAASIFRELSDLAGPPAKKKSKGAGGPSGVLMCLPFLPTPLLSTRYGVARFCG
jgi:hypothetical protein